MHKMPIILTRKELLKRKLYLVFSYFLTFFTLSLIFLIPLLITYYNNSDLIFTVLGLYTIFFVMAIGSYLYTKLDKSYDS